MPVVFCNEERITVTLETGQTPAHFYFRPLTFGQMRRLVSLKDDFKAAGDADRSTSLLTDAITSTLEGWDITDTSGAKVAFDKSALLDFLPISKVGELLTKLIAAQTPSQATDRPKS